MSSSGSVDAARAREAAAGEAMAAARAVVESRFRRRQVEGATIRFGEGRERGGRFFTAEIGLGESWVRYKALFLPDHAGPDGWSVNASVTLDDVGRLLIPRSKMHVVEVKRRMLRQDFALSFGHWFGRQVDYYQAIAQLDWTKVSLASLLASKIEDFLRSQGFAQ